MKIKCAAILYNGIVYEGNSHAEIGIKMIEVRYVKLLILQDKIRGLLQNVENMLIEKKLWK